MTVWLVVAEGALHPRKSGEFFCDESEAKRCAAGRDGQARYMGSPLVHRVLRAETVEPAGPLFGAEVLRDGTVGE